MGSAQPPAAEVGPTVVVTVTVVVRTVVVAAALSSPSGAVWVGVVSAGRGWPNSAQESR